MKFILAAAILFIANVLMANECQNRALEAAKKVDGQAARSAITSEGQLKTGMADGKGGQLSEMQAFLANKRAEAIAGATGKELTIEQKIALLSDEGAKKALGEDYKYFLAEIANPGKGAAALKAKEVAEAAAEAKRKADALAAEQKRRADEIAAEQRKKADPNYNPYLDTADPTAAPKSSSVFEKTASEHSKGSARATLSDKVRGSPYANKIDPKQHEQSSVYFGVKASIDNYEKNIRHLKEAVSSNNLDHSYKQTLKVRLQNLIRECQGLRGIAEKAGLVGSILNEVDNFISTSCK